MSMIDLKSEYDNRARVPGHPAIIAGWKADAEAFRRKAGGAIDLAYGAGARNVVDVFHPDKPSSGQLVVFIHGGYWRMFDKSSFSQMAAGAVGQGLDVAVPSYSLCPAVGVTDIIAEMRQCCLFLWTRFQRRLVVVGHSAGGHLAACLAATRWEDYGAPADLISAGMAISGVFDLRPLLVTPYNDDLKLDAATALAASPIAWPSPRVLPFDICVGADESAEFIRQSRSLSAAWRGLGLSAPCTEIAGENHFSVVNALADPESGLSLRIVELASRK